MKVRNKVYKKVCTNNNFSSLHRRLLVSFFIHRRFFVVKIRFRQNPTVVHRRCPTEANDYYLHRPELIFDYYQLPLTVAGNNSAERLKKFLQRRAVRRNFAQKLKCPAFDGDYAPRLNLVPLIRRQTYQPTTNNCFVDVYHDLVAFYCKTKPVQPVFHKKKLIH